jgi:rhamnogalacturonyl hydrolase YesR
MKSIVEAVIEAQSEKGVWSESSAKTARSDAPAVLEAAVATLGVEAVLEAVRHQGLKGDYSYLVKPLFDEAQRRRWLRNS